MHIFQMSMRTLLLCLVSTTLLLGLLKSQAFLHSDGLTGIIIIIDAGHGGIDPGGNRPGILEKDINLAVALQLRNYLHQYGAKVILSRETDQDLSDQCDNRRITNRYRRDLAARLELVEESDADLFISIHANTSSNPRDHGAEAFYYPKSEISKRLASYIQAELHTSLSAAQAIHPADFFVLRRNKIPANLIEVGYITNPEERTLLCSPQYQEKLAQAIAQGIHQFYQKQ